MSNYVTSAPTLIQTVDMKVVLISACQSQTALIILISDAESLEELGEELEANLNEMRAELKELPICMKYDLLMEPKTVKDWKKVEENCTLGYTGNLKRTQE